LSPRRAPPAAGSPLPRPRRGARAPSAVLTGSGQFSSVLKYTPSHPTMRPSTQ
jgi:hypothetical protein